MKNILLSTLTILLISTASHAHETHSHDENNNTAIKIKSVRGILGENNPVHHTEAQLRTGFITLNDGINPRNNAYALGGHYHVSSKRYSGLKVGLSAYTVLNLAIAQNPTHVNPDFFNVKNNSFMLISEAYLEGLWGKTIVTLGRQILDTPHAGSDDIRMIPNYYEAYTFSNTDINGLTLNGGFIQKMAGWENGVDSSQFVNIGKTLGTETIDGIFYTSALYDGIKDLSLSLWYYHYSNIANVLYAEAGYTAHVSTHFDINLGLQYDASFQTGNTLLQEQNARTLGISIELVHEAIGLHMLMAYNKDSGNTGASSLNLGGGPLFTSMEDQTLDAMTQAGEAWILGLGYHFQAIGIEGLNAGLAYGEFKAKEVSGYYTQELDAIIEYNFNKQFSILLAYADIDFKSNNSTDYRQVRIISNYNF